MMRMLRICVAECFNLIGLGLILAATHMNNRSSRSRMGSHCKIIYHKPRRARVDQAFALPGDVLFQGLPIFDSLWRSATIVPFL